MVPRTAQSRPHLDLTALELTSFCHVCFQTTFNAPAGNSPLALDMGSMGKGQIWINGQHVGRHWPAYKASGTCGDCSYIGTYNEKKCSTNCGEASQRW